MKLSSTLQFLSTHTLCTYILNTIIQQYKEYPRFIIVLIVAGFSSTAVAVFK